ncbi:aminotransferase class V-fold PLP-dependent enzyme [Stieleria sp. TO1_6]|uniref:aminotransferase class V-fold PLP-dependent enzyme n=1 Tax=Stieleria tagensis TaxID=2956795 RepID=UPI00209B9682|nr:aminotransferase class V-fold PLP-dependent enzyme [Stieleria tagensis]MCO8124304.1 aminotransferase class V-fold PLP-dependent enzyme [Stieleria tagensis]
MPSDPTPDRQRIYLDHAATRFPKPQIVLDTMHSFSQHSEAAMGRGAYRSSQHAGAIVAQLRREIAQWIAAENAQEISLHSNCTTALNAGIFGILGDSDHVVTTAAEHNSVLRPLHHLETLGRIQLTVVPVDRTGRVAVGPLLAAITPATRMVAVMHAANVNGVVQPIDEIGRALADRYPADAKPLLLSDTAQTFGHLPISVDQSHIDLLAAPGHKGGSGPLGTGFLYVRRRLHSQLRPSLFGGTGTHSESLQMPAEYPSSFEAGNMNVPALAGWLAGLQETRQQASPLQHLTASADESQHLAADLYKRLDAISGVRVIGRPKDLQLPIASIAIDGLPASDAAMILDSEFGIEVRSGLHCAALIHQAIDSPPDGTLRISCGSTTRRDELDQLAAALTELCR